MTRGKPAHNVDRERFPQLVEDIGEDPARFLDHKLTEYGRSDTNMTLQATVRARIRGINRLDVARAWVVVERRLDRGPRQEVIRLLEARIEELEEHGERQELETAPPVEERDDRRTAEDYENMPTLTPKPRSDQLWGSPTERLAEKARAEGRTENQDDALREELEETFADLDDQLAAEAEEAVATDGGEHRD